MFFSMKKFFLIFGTKIAKNKEIFLKNLLAE
jgi:hypothetical protein